MKRIYKKLLQLFNLARKKDFKKYYSQNGEDIILLNLLLKENIKKGSGVFLDIGANHPKVLSNTYLLYLHGYHGVLLEPDPSLANSLKKTRPKDITINNGIGPSSTSDFYILNNHTLNTFSKTEADIYCSMDRGYEIKKILQVELLEIETIIDTYFDNCPEIISIDVEGFEMKILESFNFSKHRPYMFCIETYSWGLDKHINEINIFMKKNQYAEYLTIGANTIFIRL